MGTKITLVCHHAEGDEPAWRLYEEVFESGVVYLEIEGIGVELSSRDLRVPKGGVDLVLRLPIQTATQLGLQSIVPPDRWESACDPDKARTLSEGVEELRRLRGNVKFFDDRSEPGSEEA